MKKEVEEVKEEVKKVKEEIERIRKMETLSDESSTSFIEEDTKEARNALNKFLLSLYKGQYENAAELYGGKFSSPYYGINVQNKAEFLKLHCEISGTCLKHKIINTEVISRNTFSFTMQFFTENGKLLRLGYPEKDLGFKEYTEFLFKVKKVNNTYKVMDLPPISP